MSETKLTKVSPAPWKAVGSVLAGGGLDYTVQDANGEEILALYSCDGSDEPVAFPMDANAHLIAAAPELLAALRLIVAHSHGAPHITDEMRFVVNDAIAKAEGR